MDERGQISIGRDDAMVSVSEQAKVLLLERKRAANIHEPDAGLRVAADPAGQWILVADRPRSGDQVVEHEGVTVLLVDPDTQSVLVGAMVDCLHTAEGETELALTRPGTRDGYA
jgi:Fe-S cluster assembly iron-binding protein IscA